LETYRQNLDERVPACNELPASSAQKFCTLTKPVIDASSNIATYELTPCRMKRLILSTMIRARDRLSREI